MHVATIKLIKENILLKPSQKILLDFSVVTRLWGVILRVSFCVKQASSAVVISVQTMQINI
jgi:hypothetical protein